MDQNKEGTAVHVCFRKNRSVQKHDMSFGCFLYFFPTDELQSQFSQPKQVIEKSNFFLFSCEICCLTKS